MADPLGEAGLRIAEGLIGNRVDTVRSLRTVQKLIEQRKMILEKQYDRVVRIEGSNSDTAKKLKKRFEEAAKASVYYTHAGDRIEQKLKHPSKEIVELEQQLGIREFPTDPRIQPKPEE